MSKSRTPPPGPGVAGSVAPGPRPVRSRVIAPAAAPEVSTEPAVQTPRHVTERTNRVVSYVEPPPKPGTPPDDAPDDPTASLQAFLEELSDEFGLSLRIERLPQFGNTGLWGRGALAEYCEDLQVTRDTLVSDQYLQQIQHRFGEGVYRLTLRDTTNYKIIKRWPVRVAPVVGASGVASPAFTPGATGQTNRPGPAVEDGFKRLVREVREFSEVAEALNLVPRGRVREMTSTTGETIVVEPERASLQDTILTTALGMMAKKNDHEGIERLVDRVIGRADEPAWYEVIVKQVVDAVGPRLPDLIGAIVQLVAGVPQRPGQPARGTGGNPGRVQRIGRHEPVLAAQGAVICDLCKQSINAEIHQWRPRAVPPPPFPGGAARAPVPTYTDLPPVTTGQGEEDYNEMGEPDMGEPNAYSVVDDLIDTLIELLVAAHQRGGVEPASLQVAIDAVRDFQTNAPQYSNFVSILMSGEPSMVLGLTVARQPELAGLQQSQHAVAAIKELQQALQNGAPT